MTKRILSVALAVLMLITIAFTASAATDVTKVEVRGTVFDAEPASQANVSPTWNAQTFAGFFYDLKYNRSTETMYIQETLAALQANKTIQEKKLYYETGKALIQFKVNEKEANVTVDGEENYSLVGWQAEKWIAVNDVANKIAKLAFEMGKDDKKTLATGETWALGSGYELTINAVDARASPRQVWFTLKKDGALIDEGIGQAPTDSTSTAKQKAVYYKKATILGESDSLLFTVYVDSIFSGSASDMVQFKYAWLIDQGSAKEIKGSDIYGAFEVTQATSEKIVLYNKNSVSLSQNTETTLMGNMAFKTADSTKLRFYPKVTYSEPGTYEIRGTVFDAEPASQAAVTPTWNAQTFAGFFYDLKYNRSTETMYIQETLAALQANKTIQEKKLYYETGKALIQFKVNEKEANVTVDGEENYSLVGWQAEKWIAVNDVANKIAKLAYEMGKDDKKTLATGETWALGSGYELTINAVDARASPRQVWFTLKKDGALIDEGIGQAPTDSTSTAKQKAVYYKKATILGESDSLLFTVYVDSIFSGSASDMVQFKYAWLIDQGSAKEIKGSDIYGAFEVTQATSEKIVLYNKNSVSLSQNTETTLMGDMKFKTADSTKLRFYPKVDYVISGNVTTPSGTGTATVKGTAKATTNVTSNVTAVAPTVVAPTAVQTAETKPTTAPTTVPGFEAAFAIAGLLAVAYIVLRQRK